MVLTTHLSNRCIPSVFAATLVLCPISSSATEDFTINPFHQQALAELEWRSFPTKQHLRRFEHYSGEQYPNGKWKFIYHRKFQSVFGKTSENIQERSEGSDKFFRLNINSTDDAVSRKCDNARDKIERAFGKAAVYVDKSNTTKVRVDEKSKTAFDWHFLVFSAQWFVGKTSLSLHCLGYGTDSKAASSVASVSLAIEEKARAVQLKPILWLVCTVQSSIRFSDGDERQRDEAELVFGIDFNHNDILRHNNTKIDGKATIDESFIEFKLGKKVDDKAGIPFRINRYTGSIAGEREIREGSLTAISKWSGNCRMFDKSEKKF